MLFTRLPKICSELMRSVQQILEFAAIPPPLRPRNTLRTHPPEYVDYLVLCLARFFRWAIETGVSPFPATPEVVHRFLRNLHENVGLPIPAVLAHVSAINSYHFTNDQPMPESRELGLYKSTLRAQHRRVKATPIGTLDLLAMCRLAALELPLRAARDVAILLFNFAGALRPSETCAAHVEHLDFRPLGLQVCIPTSKHNYRRPRCVTITYASSPEHCPIYALRRWLDQSGITQGPLFRRIDCYNHLRGSAGLSPQTIGDIIRRYARRSGFHGRISAYSLRRGCATTAANNGVSIDILRRHLRHEHEETTEGYVDWLPVPYEQSVTPLVLP